MEALDATAKGSPLYVPPDRLLILKDISLKMGLPLVGSTYENI